MTPAFRPITIASFLSLLGALALPAFGQAPEPEPAAIMVLGTYHFANPGRDVVKTEIADVLSEAKQAEIQEVTDALADFRPTKIAVESEPEDEARLDSLYHAYREGRHALSRNEIQQLGFRLAARFELSGLEPIDHPGEFPFGAMMEYAESHDPEFVAWVDEELERIETEMNRQQRENSIGEILGQMNDPAKLAEDHGVYMRFARVGAGDGFAGAELVSEWYERNIHIFANIQRIAAPGDRVIVIIGGGHAPILRELIGYDPELRLVEAVSYLPS